MQIQLDSLQRLQTLLQCPECHTNERMVLQNQNGRWSYYCASCGKRFPVVNGVIHLLADRDQHLTTRAFSRREAKSYDLFGSRRGFGSFGKKAFQKEIKRYTKQVEFNITDFLVDVGCGSGNYTLEFAAQLPAGIAFGIDLSPVMLDLFVKHAAKKGLINAIPILANAENLPFFPGLIDKSFNGCLHHLYPNWTTTLLETHRILRDKGILLGSTIFQPHNMVMEKTLAAFVHLIHATAIPEDDLQLALERANFHQVSVKRGMLPQAFFGTFSGRKSQAGRPLSD